MTDGTGRIAAHVGILAAISLLFGFRLGATWNGGGFYEYLTNWYWTALLLFMATAVACATVVPARHWVLALYQPVIVALGIMVWFTIAVVLALGEESALEEAKDTGLDTGDIIAAEKLTHTVPLFLLLGFCVALGIDRLRAAKEYVNGRLGGAMWVLPAMWVLALGGLFGIYLGVFVPEAVYNTSISWEIVAPLSSAVTLLVLFVFYLI